LVEEAWEVVVVVVVMVVVVVAVAVVVVGCPADVVAGHPDPPPQRSDLEPEP
jgi:hypothetical protein